MNRITAWMARAAVPLALLYAAGVAACSEQGTTPSYTVLGPDVEDLRTAFDSDSGAVRAILLTAPT